MALKRNDFKIKTLFLIYSFFRKIIKSFNHIGRLFFILFQSLLRSSKKSRGLFFETIQDNLIIADAEETYVVSTHDKVIAKSLYVKKNFDVQKFFLAKKLLNLDITDMVFVDIGANVGCTCIPLVKRKVFSKAIAIEPDPLNYRLLRSNIILNSLDDKITPIQKALGEDAYGKIKFGLSETNHGDHRIYSGNENTIPGDLGIRKTIDVDMTNLDSILETDNEKYFIWMDTQGYEGHILKGGANMMSKSYPIILEFWPSGMNLTNSYLMLKEILINSKYKFFYNLGCNKPTKVLLDSDSIDKLYYDLGETHTDILLSSN